jgi:hypothetical protein
LREPCAPRPLVLQICRILQKNPLFSSL